MTKDTEEMESCIHAIAVKHGFVIREHVVREMVAYLREVFPDRCIEKIAALMIRCSIPTGHGDTLDDLLVELEAGIKKITADAYRRGAWDTQSDLRV